MAISVTIALRECSLEFSVLPCTASGTPCYNTRATCQDVPNFTPEDTPLTLRLQSGEDLIATDRPYLLSLEHTSQRLQPEGISDFADRLDLQIQDAPSLDEQDRYDRPAQGTWWARLLARHPYLVGRPATVNIDGVETIWEVASVGYPDGQGVARMTLQAPIVRLFERMIPDRREVLRLRADIPANQNLVLASSLPEEIIVGLFYKIGSELFHVFNSTDSGIQRAVLGTRPEAHAQGDEVVRIFLAGDSGEPTDQLGGIIDPIPIPELVHTLIQNVDNFFSPLTDRNEFVAEENSGLDLRAISSIIITEATPLSEILAGLLPLAPMALHWDAQAGRIRPRGLTPWTIQAREIPAEEIINFVDGNRRMPSAVLRSDLNATRVFVRYGKRTPLDAELLGTAVAVDVEAEGPDLFGRAFDRTFEAPLLQLRDRQLAESAAQRILRRRSSPTRQPVEIAWAMTHGPDLPQVGEVVDLTLPDTIQTIEGAPALTRAQVTSARMRPVQGIVEFRALSYRPDIETDADIVLTIARSRNSYDIYEEAGRPTAPIRVLLRIREGVIVGSIPGDPASITGIGFHPDSEIVIAMAEDSQVIGRGGSAFAENILVVGEPPVPQTRDGGPAFRLGSATWSIQGQGRIAGGGGGGADLILVGFRQLEDNIPPEPDGLRIVIPGGGGAGQRSGTAGQPRGDVRQDAFGRFRHAQGNGADITVGRNGGLDSPGLGGATSGWETTIGGILTLVSGNSGAGGFLGQPGQLAEFFDPFFRRRNSGTPGAAGAAVERQLGAVVQIDQAITVMGEVTEI